MAKFKSAGAQEDIGKSKIGAGRHPVPGSRGLRDRAHVFAILFFPAIRDSMRLSMRTDKRRPDEMRPVRITTNYLMTAEGSALIEVGHTRVLCAASVEETVPQFLRGSGRGWVTAEYSMLPRATATRTPREVVQGPPVGTHARDPTLDRPFLAYRG